MNWRKGFGDSQEGVTVQDWGVLHQDITPKCIEPNFFYVGIDAATNNQEKNNKQKIAQPQFMEILINATDLAFCSSLFSIAAPHS